jgi:hypothetical protein
VEEGHVDKIAEANNKGLKFKSTRGKKVKIKTRAKIKLTHVLRPQKRKLVKSLDKSIIYFIKRLSTFKTYIGRL